MSINRGRVRVADLLLESNPRVNVEALSNRTPLFREFSSLLSSRTVASRSVVRAQKHSLRRVEPSRDARASGEVIRRNEYPMVLTSQYNRLGELQTRPQAYRAPNIPAIMTAPRREFQR